MPKREKKKRKRAPARDDMPSTIARSAERAQPTWKETRDSAVEKYGEGERAHRTALASLKHTYEKEGDRWVPKDEKGRLGSALGDVDRGRPRRQGRDLWRHRLLRPHQEGVRAARQAELVKRIEQRERSESARERRGRKAA